MADRVLLVKEFLQGPCRCAKRDPGSPRRSDIPSQLRTWGFSNHRIQPEGRAGDGVALRYSIGASPCGPAALTRPEGGRAATAAAAILHAREDGGREGGGMVKRRGARHPTTLRPPCLRPERRAREGALPPIHSNRGHTGPDAGRRRRGAGHRTGIKCSRFGICGQARPPFATPKGTLRAAGT